MCGASKNSHGVLREGVGIIFFSPPKNKIRLNISIIISYIKKFKKSSKKVLKE